MKTRGRCESISAAEAVKQGFTVDSTCYPWVAYKGPRFNPEDYCMILTDKEAATELRDVQAFMEKMQFKCAQQPSLLTPEVFWYRVNFMQEELNEFRTKHIEKDLPEAADALVDLAYVLLGTAVMMGLPWEACWVRVHEANMLKERCNDASQSKRNSILDLRKPEGWQPPDHTVDIGPTWGLFCANCGSHGFEASKTGMGCTFCDGTEGGAA